MRYLTLIITNLKFFNFDFKAKLSLKELDEKKKKNKTKYVSSDSDTYVEQLEALLARRFYKGKGKFKDKLPIMCFNCNEVGHIAARCLEKKNNISGDK